MTQVQNTSQKINKEHSFSVQLNWLEKRKGKLWAEGVESTLMVATPPAFGGEGQDWSPEHLFLGAVSSCYMSTFLVFEEKLQFSLEKLECSTTGIVEIVDGTYQFTRVEVLARIYVDQKWKVKANVAMEKTQKHCLVSNSIKCPVLHFSQIIVVGGSGRGEEIKSQG